MLKKTEIYKTLKTEIFLLKFEQQKKCKYFIDNLEKISRNLKQIALKKNQFNKNIQFFRIHFFWKNSEIFLMGNKKKTSIYLEIQKSLFKKKKKQNFSEKFHPNSLKIPKCKKNLDIFKKKKREKNEIQSLN